MRIAIIDHLNNSLIIDDVDDELIETAHECSIESYITDVYRDLEDFSFSTITKDIKFRKNGALKSGTFKVKCNGETAMFPESKRLDQIKYYSDLINKTCGKEKEHYLNIYVDLIQGKKFCHGKKE